MTHPHPKYLTCNFNRLVQDASSVVQNYVCLSTWIMSQRISTAHFGCLLGPLLSVPDVQRLINTTFNFCVNKGIINLSRYSLTYHFINAYVNQNPILQKTAWFRGRMYGLLSCQCGFESHLCNIIFVFDLFYEPTIDS